MRQQQTPSEISDADDILILSIALKSGRFESRIEMPLLSSTPGQVTAKYTLPEAGISRIGVIDPNGEAVDPSAKAAYRQGWMADIEAIQ